jgi:TonB family protein
MKNLRWIWLSVVYCAAASGQGPLIPAASYAVTGAPFTLVVETHSDNSSKSTTRRILRDSAGRQRVEELTVDGVPQSSTVMIYDVVGAKAIKLVMAAQAAVVSPMKVGRSVAVDVSQATALPPANVAPNQTLLGMKEIVGLEAWGQRIAQTIPQTDGSTNTQDRELWFSTHYRMALTQITRHEGITTTQSVMSFEPGEPDPSLFQIPPDFVVTEAPPADAATRPVAANQQSSGPLEVPPGVYRPGGNGVSWPAILKSVDPQFSQQARDDKFSGNVLISLVVDEKGLPQNVQVARPAGHGLDAKAVEAVRQYRFWPAKRNGVPVKVQITVDVNFQIY